MPTTLTDPGTCIIRLRNETTSIRCATLPRRPTSTCSIAYLNRPSSARRNRSLSIVSVIHRTRECHIILLLDVSVVILINNLNLDVDAARSNLLVGGVPRRFFFRNHHVLGEVEILIVCFYDILTGWVFETLSLGLRKGLFTCKI